MGEISVKIYDKFGKILRIEGDNEQNAAQYAAGKEAVAAIKNTQTASLAWTYQKNRACIQVLSYPIGKTGHCGRVEL